MKALLSVALLSSLLQLCSSAPVLEPLTCGEDVDNRKAAHLAIHHINEQHRHGYKFKISEISGAEEKEVDQGCDVTVQLYLKETRCHVIDPTDFEECPERGLGERVVVANCSVLIMVKGNTNTVAKYDCVTRQELTNVEMMSICPDCPSLIPLNDTEGLKSIHKAVTEFNKNTTNQNVFVLQQVGRMKITYIPTTGMNYYAEFTLVETVCPRNSRILHEACDPKCPDRAKHAFCKSGYSRTNGLYSVECQVFPAKNSTALRPGEEEPICRPTPPHIPHVTPLCLQPPHAHGPPPHAHGPPPPPHAHGPPPHAHGPPPPPHAHGRPPHAHGPPPHAHGPPPHAHGPPPHAHGLPPPPFRPVFSAHCLPMPADADPAIHPICPWPQLALLPLPGPECVPIERKEI